MKRIDHRDASQDLEQIKSLLAAKEKEYADLKANIDSLELKIANTRSLNERDEKKMSRIEEKLVSRKAYAKHACLSLLSGIIVGLFIFLIMHLTAK